MARIIFKCPYLKPGDTNTHRANLVRYIATRDGSIPYQHQAQSLPATQKQQDLIQQLVATMPDTTELFEYQDYLHTPTVANASAYISAAAEYEFFARAGRGRFLSYMATRPGVATSGAHGLFGSENKSVVLAQAMQEVAAHPGNVWTPIISLHREDAFRFGYDNPANWQALLQRHAHDMAIAMKILPDDFRWYAAFHDEGHHPHIHMVCYSNNPKEGFLTVQGIRKIKSVLANDIFRQELVSIYQAQTLHRDETADIFRHQLAGCIAQMESGTLHSPQITETMLKLVDKLKHHSGKKQYGYLRPPVKALVDSIVDELARDSRVAGAYEQWRGCTQQIVSTYEGTPLPSVPLSQQKEFKHIRNMVVQEAVTLLEGGFQLEDVTADAPEPAEPDTHLPETDEAVPEQTDFPAQAEIQNRISPSFRSRKGTKGKQNIGWTEEYKAAQLYLYGNDEQAPDLPKAFAAMTAEAEKGNALAMHDLGRMYADGLGCEADKDASFGWYEKALQTFLRWESAKPNKYFEYRIGKMYAYALGCEMDEACAAKWFQQSAAQEYKYAQYSLGCFYRDGKGVEKDAATAFALFSQAAEQSFPYASFELGKLCRDGVGTHKDEATAHLHFEDAFLGFEAMAREVADDKLLYRIGWMLLTGTGCEKDVRQAEETFIKAARLGNLHAKYQLAKLYVARENIDPTVFQQAVDWMQEAAEDGNSAAQYALGKLYLEAEQIYNPTLAVRWLERAAADGNEFAQYRLGKLFLQGQHVPPDIPLAIRWLETSAAQDNAFAMHLLGKVYSEESYGIWNIPLARMWLKKAALLDNEHSMYRLGKSYLQDEPHSVQQALYWLEQAAERGNQFAQYALGKAYLFHAEIPKDEAAAKKWFTLAAAQGNIYAGYMLQHMDEWRHGQAMLASTRLLAGIAKLFQSSAFPATSWRGHQMDKKRVRELRRQGKAHSSVQAMLDEEIHQSHTL